jgi:hypothetical protein
MCADVLTLSDGKLMLNESICWADLWGFERSVACWEQGPSSDARRNVINLYHGRFLDRDGEIRWIAKMRDRLAAKY